MSGYTKLFSSILASTIWREDKDTRIVWITLLAMADSRGVAEGSVPGLADFARLSVDETRKALLKLASPDPDSRTQDFDGRRIQPVDGGWLILNHGKYREKMSTDERREYKRIKQGEYRAAQAAAKAAPVDTPVDSVDSVDKGGQMCTELTHTSPDPSPDPSPVQTSSMSVGEATFRPVPVAKGPHRAHAFCWRVCVPSFLHDKFRRRLGGEDPDETLRAWYLEVSKSIPDDERIAVDDVAFWETQYALKWGDGQTQAQRLKAAAVAKGNAALDEWART